MDLVSRLSEMTRVVSIHKSESGTAAILKRQWDPFLSETRTDTLGNFIGLVRGFGPEPRPSVLAAAHMDVVGFMVAAVTEGGFLRLSPVGGPDRRLILGQEVDVVAEERVLTGIVGAKPPHLTQPQERTRAPAFEDLYVDLGLPEDEVRALVPPGRPVLYRRPLLALRNGRVAGRYLDDTAGLAAIGVALAELRTMSETVTSAARADFVAVGTAGEETGAFPGARTVAYELAPDIAIAVDVTFATYPGEDDPTTSYPLGEGPTIGVGPNCHPVLAAFLKDTAEEAGLPFNTEVLPGNSGTDAWAMQTARGGIPTAVLSIPVRYMHTPVELAAISDIRAAGRLLALTVARVTRDLVLELARGGDPEW